MGREGGVEGGGGGEVFGKEESSSVMDVESHGVWEGGCFLKTESSIGLDANILWTSSNWSR